MATETITIRVDARAAQAFKAAPEAQRQKLEQLLSLRLNAQAFRLGYITPVNDLFATQHCHMVTASSDGFADGRKY